jgi:hypothetical protein
VLVAVIRSLVFISPHLRLLDRLCDHLAVVAVPPDERLGFLGRDAFPFKVPDLVLLAACRLRAVAIVLFVL